MPCSHGYWSPAEYLKYASEHIFDKCINVFGRTSEEILKALEFYDRSKQEQIKMTREEARKLISQKHDGVITAGALLNCLEALGLLKFDEPEMVEWRCEGIVHRYPKGYDPNRSSGLLWTKVIRPQSEFLTIHVGNHTHDVALETIVKALKAKGYVVYSPGKLS